MLWRWLDGGCSQRKVSDGWRSKWAFVWYWCESVPSVKSSSEPRVWPWASGRPCGHKGHRPWAVKWWKRWTLILVEVCACLSDFSISSYQEMTAKLWAILWAEWDERPGFACVCQELGCLESLRQRSGNLNSNCPAACSFPGKGSRKQNKKLVWLPSRCALWRGLVWGELSRRVLFDLEGKMPWKPAGLELSEAVGSQCGNAAQSAAFSPWGIVWSVWKERAHPGTQSALFAAISSKLDISRCL